MVWTSSSKNIIKLPDEYIQEYNKRWKEEFEKQSIMYKILKKDMCNISNLKGKASKDENSS